MKHKKIEKTILNIFRLMPIFCLLLFILYFCLTGFTKVKANTYDNTNTDNPTEETTTYFFPNGSYYKNILYFNQLVKTDYLLNKYDTNGLSFSSIDGGFIINGVATNENVDYNFLTTTIDLTLGHYYFIHNTGSVLDCVYSLENDTASYSVSELFLNNIKTCRFYKQYRSGDTFNNFIVQPQIFDLTLMFGSGYEPTTIEELSKYIDLSVFHYYTLNEEIIFNSDNIISFDYYLYKYGFLDNITYYFNDYIFKYTDILFNGSINIPFNAFANAITLSSESIFYTYVKFSYLYLLYIFLIDILYLLYNIIVFIPKWLITEFEKRT